MANIINLDAGHGINTAGKRSPDGVREWTLNNAVVLEIIKLLSAYECTVFRLDDPTGQTDVAIDVRRSKGERNGGILVSIHHNAFEGKWGNHTGTETFYGQTTFNGAAVNSKSKELANDIQDNAVRLVPLKNRGVKSSNSYGVIRTSIPAVLVEGGFYDSTVDFPIITSADGQKKYAQAVCEGIVSFMGLKKKDGTTVSTTPSAPQTTPSGGKFTVGDTVTVNGYPCINASGGSPGKLLVNYKGKITRINPSGSHRYHIDAKGWCKESDLSLQGGSSAPTPAPAVKKILLNAGTWNVRNAPNMQGKVVKTVKGGCEIPYTGITVGWYKVDGGYLGPAAVKKVLN